MKWIGQHIWDFVSRFNSEVYLQGTETGTIASGGNLGLDANNKVVKATTVSSATLASTVTVTDSNAVTSFPIVFHDESNALLDDTGAFEYVPGTTTLYMNRSGGGAIDLSEIADNSTDFHIHMRNTKGGNAGDDGDDLGSIKFYGKNDAGSPETIEYGSIKVEIADASDSDEAGKIELQVATEGGRQQALTATGGGTTSKVDVGLGYGAASTTTIAGKLVATSKTIAVPAAMSAHGTHDGDVVYMGGTSSMTVGRIYHFKSDGTWELADPNAASTSTGLLGVALGSDSDTDGMLLRGMVTLDHDPGARGDVLYLDEQQVSSAYGAATSGAPAGTSDIVRVVGYCMQSTQGQIWFNPDNTWVEIA